MISEASLFYHVDDIDAVSFEYICQFTCTHLYALVANDFDECSVYSFVCHVTIIVFVALLARGY